MRNDRRISSPTARLGNIKGLLLIIAGLALLLLLSQPVANAEVEATWVGGTGGLVNDVEVFGNHTYVSTDSGLLIINVSNKIKPVLTSFVPFDNGHALGLTISNGFAYVTDGEDGFGLRIINISNPDKPKIVSNVTFQGCGWDVVVSGNYAYIASNGQGLQIINISNPTTPQIVSSLNVNTALGIAVQNNYVYIADEGKGLRIINVTNSSAPEHVGSYETPGRGYSVTVNNDYAYVADYNRGLRIINVTDPTTPTKTGNYYNNPELTWDLAFSNNYIYLANGMTGLRIIDVNDPASPIEIGNVSTSGNTRGIAIGGNYAFLADENCGLVIVNISDPNSPTISSNYITLGESSKVVAEEDYIYVADGDGGLLIINVSTPTKHVVKGMYDTPGKVQDLAVNGTLIYLADGGGGLRIIDVTNSSQPHEIGTYNTPGYASGITIDGRHAYIVDGSSGIQIIDISDPESPEKVGHISTYGRARAIAIAGKYAYLSDWDGGFRIIDVSNLSAPEEVSNLSALRGITAIKLAGTYVYVVNDYGYLRVINVSNPASPEETDKIDCNSRWNYDVKLSQDFAYVAAGKDGLIIISLSNLSDLQMVGFSNTPGFAMGVDIINDFVFIADYENGLQIIQINFPLKAIIDSISLSAANEGDVVTFIGNTTPLTEVAIAYQWRSSIDGNLTNSTNLTISSLSPGLHTISFRAQEDDGVWSPWATATFYVNAHPKTSIISITPSSPTEGDAVTFTGSATDTNGSVVAYEWRSSLDGLLGSTTIVTRSNLSPGNHTISFRAQDDDGAWSPWVTATFYVNARPRASIVFITPSSPTEGDAVTFTGSATDTNGSVVAYEWRSSLDGLLGSTSIVTTSNLSPGNHTISFRAQDDDGAWSDPATLELEVKSDSDEDNSFLPSPGPAALGVTLGLAALIRRRR